MERRKAKRNQVQVELEIAQPGAGRCHGYAENISRNGVSVVLWEGDLPAQQRSVILNFRIWTGAETIHRRICARVVRRSGEDRIALRFAEHDFMAEAVIQDLMFYRNRDRRREVRRPLDVSAHAPLTTSRLSRPL